MFWGVVMKIDGSAVRAGMVVEYENKLCLVISHEIRTPGNLSSFNQVEMKDIKTGNKINTRLGQSDKVDRVSLDQRKYQYLFAEGDDLTFMDAETYEQIFVKKSMLGQQFAFLQDGMTVDIETYEGTVLNVALPSRAEGEIAECEPVVKGQTAASSYKPAMLTNGVRVMVPPFIDVGTRIVVNTTDLTYIERAKAS